MNQESIKAIELDRKKRRIMNNLTIAFYDSSLQDSENLVLEASRELEELKEEHYGNEVPTVASVVKSLYDLSQAEEITDRETGESTPFAEVQEMYFIKIDLLASLLGIELEG